MNDSFWIDVAKNLTPRFKRNRKEYYTHNPVWPFTMMEEHQIRYLIHKNKQQDEEKFFQLERAPF
jgi:hypothetical protein